MQGIILIHMQGIILIHMQGIILIHQTKGIILIHINWDLAHILGEAASLGAELHQISDEVC